MKKMFLILLFIKLIYKMSDFDEEGGYKVAGLTGKDNIFDYITKP